MLELLAEGLLVLELLVLEELPDDSQPNPIHPQLPLDSHLNCRTHTVEQGMVSLVMPNDTLAVDSQQIHLDLLLISREIPIIRVIRLGLAQTLAVVRLD
jgi:hypothetical protein